MNCCDEYGKCNHDCNQGKDCDCRPDPHDHLIMVLEAALIALMATMGVLAWRLW